MIADCDKEWLFEGQFQMVTADVLAVNVATPAVAVVAAVAVAVAVAVAAEWRWVSEPCSLPLCRAAKLFDHG